MKRFRIVEAIANLKIPDKAKAELLMLWRKARGVAESILCFLQRHHEFCATLLLGALIAYLLSHIPWIGGFLALCALVTAAALGVLKQLRSDIEALFEPVA